MERDSPDATAHFLVTAVVAVLVAATVGAPVAAVADATRSGAADGSTAVASSNAAIADGQLQADNETVRSDSERVVRELLVKTIAAAEGDMPLVAGQGFGDKVARLEITDSTVRFGEGTNGTTNILVSVTMHNPNAASVKTPKFAGTFEAEDVLLYRWRAKETTIRNAPADGRLDSGATRELTYVLPIDGLAVQRNISYLRTQAAEAELEVNYHWKTTFVTDAVTIPGGDGVQCEGTVNVEQLSQNVQEALPDVECENPAKQRQRQRGPRPDIKVKPSSLSFQDATVDETSTREVTVRNVGNASLRVNRTTIAGKRTFDVSGPSSFTLAPGASRTLTVSFTPRNDKPDSATLHIASNDRDEADTTVWLSSSGIEANVTVESYGQRTDLGVDANNVSAGESVSISIPETNETADTGEGPDAKSKTDDEVDVESVSVTPEEKTNFSMNVTASEKPLSSTPNFDRANATDGMGYMSVDHTIDNDEVKNVSITFEMNRSELERRQSEADDVKAYRYVNGSWVATETTLVNESGRRYTFRANASGFSEWTTAAQVPRINVTDAAANVTAATTADTVTIEVLLTNTGGSDGLFVTKLLLNGSVVERREVTVAPNASSLVTFERRFGQPGSYAVQVNKVFVATVDISQAEREVEVTEQEVNGTAGGNATDESGASGTGTAGASGPGFGVLTAVLALLGAALLARLRR